MVYKKEETLVVTHTQTCTYMDSHTDMYIHVHTVTIVQTLEEHIFFAFEWTP